MGLQKPAGADAPPQTPPAAEAEQTAPQTPSVANTGQAYPSPRPAAPPSPAPRWPPPCTWRRSGLIRCTAEADLEQLRAEGLTGRQLRLAMRVAQRHGIKASSGLEAVRMLRQRGIDPFGQAALDGHDSQPRRGRRHRARTGAHGRSRRCRGRCANPAACPPSPPLRQRPAPPKLPACAPKSPSAAAAGCCFWQPGCRFS
jgi:hypothetical protein